MSANSEPIFYDIDPSTGEATPTSRESVREVLTKEANIASSVPDEVATNLNAAIERIGMSYERANAGDWTLFGIHNDATVYVSRALELALKERLGREKGTLQELANRAIQQGLMAETDRNLIDLVRAIRNSAAHDAEPYGGPPVAATLVRHTARVLNGMYEA